MLVVALRSGAPDSDVKHQHNSVHNVYNPVTRTYMLHSGLMHGV